MKRNHVFDAIFNSPFGEMIATDFYHSIPSANVVESDKEFIYTIALPGQNKEDISVEIENNYLKISVKKSEISTSNYKRKEFDYNGSSRKFFVHDTADYQTMKAQYIDGLLSISVDKKVEVITNNIQISIN